MWSKNKQIITLLGILIAIAASTAAATGIFTSEGSGPYEYLTIRGETVEIYGKGIYRHMSAEVAPQGVAQDYVTLFVAIPLLLVSLLWARKGSLRGRFILTGTLGYLLVTYLFYMLIGMYNALFLVYAFLMGTSFFAFTLSMLSFDLERLPGSFHPRAPVKFAGGFLIFNAAAIAFIWLSVIVPPLLDGSIYPVQLEHYTTLVVQGMDLGLLLPLAVVSGVMLMRKRPAGYLFGLVYLIFLSILMAALTAKIIGMGMLGYEIIPVVFIIPTFMLVAVFCSVLLLRRLQVSQK